MKSLNTVLLESVETRWTLSDRINNRYFLDTKSRLKACLEGGIEAQMAARIAGNSIGTIQKHYVQLGTLNARNAVNKLVLVK